MDPEQLKLRTKQFALRVMKMTDALPRNPKGKVLANQILRSATAVASGYRAACRARSKAAWTDETLLWLELIDEGGLLRARQLASLVQEANELTAIFASIHKSSKS